MHVNVDHLVLAANRVSIVAKAALQAQWKKTGRAPARETPPLQWKKASTFEHVLVLKHILVHPGCSQADIAYGLGLHSGSVSNLMKPLRAAELIDEKERYGRPRAELSVTETGERFLRTANATIQKALAGLASEIGADALLDLAETSSKIRNVLAMKPR